jgi:leader peptidase (prepilin peptidase)/N-methyltransferase
MGEIASSWLPWVTPWSLGLLGLCVGSFINVVAHRLPKMMERQWWAELSGLLGDSSAFQNLFGKPAPSEMAQAHRCLESSLENLPALNLARPASRCPACGHRITWFENIPLLSWLWLKGQCSACSTPISWRYPLVELSSGILFASVGWAMGSTPQALVWCGVMSVLLALALIDWDTTYLPDSLTLPLLWAGLLVSVLGWGIPLQQALWGAMAGYLSLWSVYWFFKLATGKEGMGFGDFKLLAALGAWLGPWMILPVVLLASVFGAFVGIAMKLRSKLREGRYVPFGPFLAGAGAFVALAGQDAVLAWLGWR